VEKGLVEQSLLCYPKSYWKGLEVLTMKLIELLERLDYECLGGSLEKEVTAIVNDSRKVTEGALFLCIRGAVSDGHKYAADVIEKGAGVLVVEEPVQAPESVTVIKVADSRYAMALISAAWYGYPAEKLKVIGITGTKGKTTTTYMVKSILEAAGHKVGLIGTIEAIIGDEVIPAKNTTPESMTIQEYFAKMVKAGCDSVVMEVSSQGLMLHRTAGIPFELGIFTNIEPDHIGPAEHESFEDYMHCKGLLFQQCKVGIVNADDAHLEQVLEGHTCQIETFGFSEKADLRAENAHMVTRPGYLGISYHVAGTLDMDVEIDIPGKFSVYNSLTAIAICRHFGVKEEDIKNALKQAKVKGRIEMVKVSDEFTLMIDYAHNAMALESLLTTLKDYHPKRIVCLFGCGGNRAKSRRFEMGEVSGKLADFTIITSDNPRFEKPEDILADIETGIRKTDGKYIKIIDRKEAIAYAIHHGQPGDVIVLAGKGHEDYQEIEGKKYPMDERVLIQEILEEDRKGNA
jgi:UDP-N-acetylmuramoyl-L-alanyl-D-glutamate--2,6-diaminopimelate ligase